MHPNVINGYAELSVIVTSAMTAQLAGKEIHPVYSTFWLTYHAECAARNAIEPYFDNGENALGGELSLRHEAMAAIGSRVRVCARVSAVTQKSSALLVTCTIEAFAEHVSTEKVRPTGAPQILARRIASGSHVQIVLPQGVIDERVRQAQCWTEGAFE